MATPDTSGYQQYLVTNRAFMDPVVAAATNHLGAGGRAVDLGTGAGGALPHLARVSRRVTGVDLQDTALDLARRHVEAHGLGASTDVVAGDGVALVEGAARDGDPVDLVWAADVVWPSIFDDPADVVRRLGDAVAPGGAVALLASSYYRSVHMPGHTRLERLVQTASELTWGLPTDGEQHPELLGAWLDGAGLAVELHACGRTALLAHDDAARAYVTGVVWPEYRHAARESGRAAGMTDDDLARVEELLDPESPQWLGRAPSAYVLTPALLWVGRRR